MIRDGIPVKRIDIDEEPDLPRRYKIEGVPAFVVVDRDGRELGRTSGARSASDLARFFKTAAAKARPVEEDAGRHTLKSGDRRSGDDDPDDDPVEDAPKRRPKKIALRLTQTRAPYRPSPIPDRGKRSSASGSSARVPPDSDRGPSFTATTRSH